jgi:hypothetical protein
MRVLVVAALSLYLALAALAPHVHLHAAGQGADECAVCAARSGEAATRQTPDLMPAAVLAGRVPLAPGLAPVSGAPLGAVPGQSPPRA